MVRGVSQCQFRRATNSACTAGAVTSGATTGTNYTFNGLTHNTRYYYCVRGRMSNGLTSSWSSTTHSRQDNVAPTASMNALDAVQTGTQFTVRWSGSDSGSGVQKYRVQVRVGGGSWTTWQSGTSATSATYTGQYGHTYSFRVRAYDRANNASAYTSAVTTQTPGVTKYYYFGSQRVAVRENGTLTYLHADHLGSASLATNASGAKIANSDVRYYPFGETRPGQQGTALPTDRRYTGQRQEAGLGLYDYAPRSGGAPATMTLILTASSVPTPLYRTPRIRKVSTGTATF